MFRLIVLKQSQLSLFRVDVGKPRVSIQKFSTEEADKKTPVYRPPMQKKKFVKPGLNDREYNEQLNTEVFEELSRLSDSVDFVKHHAQTEAVKRERHDAIQRRAKRRQERDEQKQKKAERISEVEQVFRQQKERDAQEKSRIKKER